MHCPWSGSVARVHDLDKQTLGSRRTDVEGVAPRLFPLLVREQPALLYAAGRGQAAPRGLIGRHRPEHPDLDIGPPVGIAAGGRATQHDRLYGGFCCVRPQQRLNRRTPPARSGRGLLGEMRRQRASSRLSYWLLWPPAQWSSAAIPSGLRRARALRIRRRRSSRRVVPAECRHARRAGWFR